MVIENPKDAANPIALDPLEEDLGNPQNFKHYDLKWINFDDIKSKAVEEAEVTQKLKELSVFIFKRFGGRSYIRIDYRMDRDGNIFFLEINGNPAVYYE